MKCIFCDIVNRLSPAEFLLETEDVFAFLDINPMNFGHALVIPRQHYADLKELPPELVPEMFQTAQRVAVAVTDSLKADGFNVVVNNGRAAGQSVYHCHIHIIPRYFSDEFKFRLNLKQYQHDELSKYGSIIRNSLA